MNNVNNELVRIIRGSSDEFCGDPCIYRLELTGKQLFFARCRVVEKLYNLGFRVKKSFTEIQSLLSKNLHLACDPEKIDIEKFFSISNLFIDEPNQLNGTKKRKLDKN